MTAIGTSLVFYLRYYAEMQKLYEEEGDLTDLASAADGEEVSKKITAVGNQACVEAADLLEACVSNFQERLKTTPNVSIKPCRRDTMERNWEVVFEISQARRRKSAGVTREIGVYLEPEEIVPWIWSRGGRLAEDRICSLLPGISCRRSKQMGWDGGSVALPTVKIPWQVATDFHVEKEPIVKQVDAVLQAVTSQFLASFLKD